MKEITGNALNISFIATDDGLVPFCEIILITSEPQWSLDGGGGMSKRRVAETHRFGAMSVSLRKLGQQLIEYADEADEALRTLRESGKLAPLTLDLSAPKKGKSDSPTP